MEAAASSTVSSSILQSYHPDIKPLDTYLRDVLNSDAIPHWSLVAPDDSERYNYLLKDSFVAQKESMSLSSRQSFKVATPRADITEIICQAQKVVFKKKSHENIITLGYYYRNNKVVPRNHGMTRPGVENNNVNTIVTSLQGEEWRVLLSRIGEDAMMHLLTETAIFLSLPNNCFCQMTGEPLINLPPPRPLMNPRISSLGKRSTKLPALDERPTKLQRTESIYGSRQWNDPNTTLKTVMASPADVTICRSRLFFAKPATIPHTNQIMCGFQPNHILNRLIPSYPVAGQLNVDDKPDYDPRQQQEKARHLSKYIFPRQYGLSSTFTFKTSTWGRPVTPTFTDRGAEIRPSKTPKRLKETLGHLDTLIWRHGKCKYKLLHDQVCPSKVVTKSEKPLESSVILELLSEQTSQLQTQASLGEVSLDSVGNSIFPFGLTQARRYAENKPRFVEFSCSHFEVYRYVFLVTQQVIPHRFWGSDSNFKHICRSMLVIGQMLPAVGIELVSQRHSWMKKEGWDFVINQPQTRHQGHRPRFMTKPISLSFLAQSTYVREFISLRRFETFSLHRILQGLSTSDCEWLMPSGSGEKQTRTSVSDTAKRRELLEDFFYWYFDSFVLNLLKTTFFITESSAFKNKVLYFRQDDWKVLCEPLLDRLTSGTFEKMEKSEAEEIIRQRKLGYSFVRLLPKETGVRPIANLRRKQVAIEGGLNSSEQSINQILQVAFKILTYERKTRPHLLGASVFGSDDVYVRLRSFKDQLVHEYGNELPGLYFVKVDVQACFDSIDQAKLLTILRNVISEENYVHQRYGKVSSTAGKIKRTFAKDALPEDARPDFLEYATQLAGALRHTIFVDQVVYPRSKRHEIWDLLEQHITENIIKIGQDYYRQVIGIPQGSVLSSILCAFFYGDLEKKFKQFTEEPGSVLLRQTDDYLLITVSSSRAKEFLGMMDEGHPEYGCFISKDKTMTNFDYGSHVLNVTDPHQQSFLWCGYSINMKDLSVSEPLEGEDDLDLRNTLTVNKMRRPGSAFVFKMLQQCKRRIHVLFSDGKLNTERVIHLNIYQNFVLSAMKMHGYLSEWGIDPSKRGKMLYRTVKEMIAYFYASFRNTTRNKFAKSLDAQISVSRAEVDWLGYNAFYTVLSRKPRRYTWLLKELRGEIGRLTRRGSRCRKRFRGLFAEGLGSMEQIAY